ncbi:MAG: pilus assembly protein TadB [Actinomycetota bacterium]|nr:pilus assembly protein TadB [Actinomycetota bacterium]MDA3004509.1 pilus assembly protein TadB [Actinomycetota bacterium]
MITTFVSLCCGAAFGLGLFGVLLNIKKANESSSKKHISILEVKTKFLNSLKFFGGPAVALVVYLLTAWLLVSVVTGLVVSAVPALKSKQRLRRDERGLADAIATWTEQLRDTLAGAHGLEQAIVATSVHAPLAISSAVSRLSAQIQYGKLSDGLRRFADDVDHPISDFVSAALITATEYQARDLAQLLGHLAQCARDEGRMRTRIWVGRARTRSSVRIITFVVISFVCALVVFNREYLNVYSSFEGQIILSGIFILFGCSLIMLDQFSRIAAPQRFIRRRETVR